jgi:hypothetical protein
MKNKSPVRDIYIVHESGLLLISHHFHNGDTQPDIISGFLIAMANFAERMMGESIEEIKLDQHMIVYRIIRPIFIALVTEPKMITKRKINMLIKAILTKFFDEYVGYLQEGILEPAMFSEFNTTLENVIKASFSLKLIN